MQSPSTKSDSCRIELDYPLDIDEIGRLLLTGSGGKLQDFAPQSNNTTGGVEDTEGQHVSLHKWVGHVTSGTGSGPGKQVIVGITDYEYIGKSPADMGASGRRQGHHRFFVQGNTTAVHHVVDIFKKVVPGTLWRSKLIP